MGSGAVDGEFSYSGLAMEGIKGGKIASTRQDSVHFTFNQAAGSTKQQMTGDLANIVASDIDIGVLAALFDPGKATDDQYHRVYGHISAGPYVITSSQGVSMRIDGMTTDDIGLKPSRMQLSTLMAMVPPPGSAPPTKAQARAMIERLAGLYEGIRIGKQRDARVFGRGHRRAR